MLCCIIFKALQVAWDLAFRWRIFAGKFEAHLAAGTVADKTKAGWGEQAMNQNIMKFQLLGMCSSSWCWDWNASVGIPFASRSRNYRNRKKDNVISAGCTVLCQGLFEVLAFDQLLRSSSFDPTGNEAFQVHNVHTYQHDSEEKKHQ